MVATALQLVEMLKKHDLTITTAESCTGGMLAAAITDVAGASAVFNQGIICYANSTKISLLDVNAENLEKYGAVSSEIACEMAEGARIKASSDIAISITGIAGPSGGTDEKPVGTVFIAVATKNEITVKKFQLKGNRQEIRNQSVTAALRLAIIAD